MQAERDKSRNGEEVEKRVTSGEKTPAITGVGTVEIAIYL